MSRAEIEAAIPHRPPFLFLDEIVSREEKKIVCRKLWTSDEWFFAGHYPQYPLAPGVLLCEAAMQAGAVLLAPLAPSGGKTVPVATRVSDIRFKRMVRPGDTTDIAVELTEQLSEAFYMTAKITVGGALAVRLDFVVMMTAVATPTTS